MPVTPWSRPFFEPGGAAAHVLTWVFSAEPVPERLPIAASRHGVPGAALCPQLTLNSAAADEQPEWFQAFFQEPNLSLARRDLGDAFDAYRQARFCTTLTVQLPDPQDLTYLQDAWAVTRCLCEGDALAVLQGHAARWLTPAQVLERPVDRPFHIRDEIALIFEMAETPGVGHIMFSRGMATFGRPDIIFPGASPKDAELMWRLAENLARGARAAIGTPLLDGDGNSFILQPYRPGADLPELFLQNPGVVVARQAVVG